MNDITNNIFNGDCLEVMKTFPDNCIDCVLMDPPYAISRDTGFAVKKPVEEMTPTQRKFNINMQFGEWDQCEVDMGSVFKQLYRIVKPHATVICFYDLWKIESLRSKMESSGFKQIRLIEWLKTNPVPINSKTNYLTNAREIAVCCVKQGKPTFNSEYDNGVYNYGIPRKNHDSHPTMKPVQLISDLVLKHTNENDIILDCFMGSGTTCVAAIMNSRRYVGIERDVNYFNVARKNIDEALRTKGLK